MFIHRKTDTYTLVYSHDVLWTSNKKKQTTDVCQIMSKSQKSCVQQEKPNKKITYCLEMTHVNPAPNQLVKAKMAPSVSNKAEDVWLFYGRRIENLRNNSI